MPENRSQDPEDPFAPPGASSDVTLDLAEPEPSARPQPRGGSQELEPPPLVIPAARKPVAYKNHGGFGNLLVWLVGGAVVLGGIGFGAMAAKRMFAGKTDQPTAAQGPAGPGAKGAAAAPAKPVTWTAVKTGDAVLVTVEVTPRNARLMLDGEPVASNPIRIPRGGQHTLTATADGFEPGSAEVVADAARTVRLKLKKSRR